MKQQQSGAVLIISLLILILLTLLGLTAIQASVMQERIAGSTRQLELAFEAAEAALRAGEFEVSGVTRPIIDGSEAGMYHYGLAPAPYLRTPEQWDAANALLYPLSGDDDWQVAQAPEFTIEELPPVRDPGGSLDASAPEIEGLMYRISARGFGGVANATVILQSTYRR